MDTLALDGSEATTPHGMTSGQPADGDDLLTIAQAAEALGLSVKSVRRRIKAGSLEAEQVDGKFGAEWRVRLTTARPGVAGADHSPSAGHIRSDHGTSNGRMTNGREATTPQTTRADQGIARLADLLERAQDDIRRLNDERAELYGRLGYMQAQLAAKDEQIKALEAPKEPIAPPPPAGALFRPLPTEPDPPRRPWWRFW